MSWVTWLNTHARSDTLPFSLSTCYSITACVGHDWLWRSLANWAPVIERWPNECRFEVCRGMRAVAIQQKSCSQTAHKLLLLSQLWGSCNLRSGVAWVIGTRGGLQFCRPQKSWDAWCFLYHHILPPLLIAGGPLATSLNLCRRRWMTRNKVPKFHIYEQSIVAFWPVDFCPVAFCC